MLTTDTTQLQQYQQMLDLARQPQQQVSGIFGQLNNPSFNPRDMLIQTHGNENKPMPVETTAMSIIDPERARNAYQVASSQHYPRGHPDDQEKYGNLNYKTGLGSLINRFGNLGGPKQPQSVFENQFSELQNQMGGFGEQFTGLETSIGGLGESITAITDRLDSIEQGIQGLKTNDPSQAYTRMNWQPFSSWGRRY